MNRYATFLAIVTLGTGFAAVQTIDERPCSDEPIGLQEALSNQQKVTDLLTQYRIFKGSLQATVESLRRGEIRLKEAHALVREAANRYYPKYLNLLVFSDQGSTTDERLARNLAGHVLAIEHTTPTNPSPLPRLEVELRDLLAELGQ